MPEPIGEPSGITAAHPASSSRRARIGSSFVYGRTTKPSSTSASAAAMSSTASGNRVRSSPITSSLIQSVSNPSPAVGSTVSLLPATCWLATLHRPHDLDRLPLGQPCAVPVRVAHDLAVDGDRDASALPVQPHGLHRIRDARPVGKLGRPAVHLHDHVVTSLVAGAAASPGALSSPNRPGWTG